MSSDYRSPQLRERIIEMLEEVMKDKPHLPITDPRLVEDSIFRTSQTMEEYIKKLNTFFQRACPYIQSQTPIQTVPQPTSGNGSHQPLGPTGLVQPTVIGIGAPSTQQLPPDPEKTKLIQQQLVLLLHARKCLKKDHAGQQSICQLPYCGMIKNILTHMDACQDGRTCKAPHCASSRQIVDHWKTCQRTDCHVCSPVKAIRNGSSSNSSQGAAALSQDSTSWTLESVLPSPEPASVQKQWHQQVKSDLRIYLMSKMIKIFIPLANAASMQEQPVRDLIQYARKVEKDYFELANSREGYYTMMAQKIFKMQDEFEKKKLQKHQALSTGSLPTDGGVSVGILAATLATSASIKSERAISDGVGEVKK